MRILLLVTDLDVGGTPMVVRELAIRLHRSPAICIEVMSLKPWGPLAGQLLEAGIKTWSAQAQSAGDLPRVLWEVGRFCGHFDVVFSFLVHANAIAAAVSYFCTGVRFIQSIQTTQRRPVWHWWLQRLAQQRAEKIVVPTASVAVAARRWSKVPPEKIVVIPNAVDPDQFAPAQARNVPKVRVGFLGRLDPVKRVTDLVAAMSLLDERFMLRIFGEGPDQNRIMEEVLRLGLDNRTIMEGFAAGPKEAMEKIDILALPSECEGFGLVLIEAMAAGVPVVATDVPGIRDVVRGGETGLLVPPACPADLAQAIKRIAEDHELRDRLITNGLREVREKYSWQKVLPMYRSLLRLQS